MACDPIDDLLWACRSYLQVMDALLQGSRGTGEVSELIVGIRAQLDQLAAAVRQADRSAWRTGDPGE